MENEISERHTIGQHNDFETFVDRSSQNHVIESNFSDKIGRAVDNAVLTVKKRMHDAILTAMDQVVNPKIEMAAKSITGSSGLVNFETLIEGFSYGMLVTLRSCQPLIDQT